MSICGKRGFSPDLCHFSTTSRPLASPEPWPIPRGPAGELLSLDFLRPENIRDTLHAYQLAKRCSGKRVMAQAVAWGRRGARLNAIAPGILVTPLALDEFHGPRETSTKICSPSALPDAPARRTGRRTWPSS